MNFDTIQSYCSSRAGTRTSRRTRETANKTKQTRRKDKQHTKLFETDRQTDRLHGWMDGLIVNSILK
jgi:hypothetical protein